MDTSTEPLGGLPSFLAFLGSSPSGDEVAERLVHGPGAVFDAAIGLVLVLEDSGLHIVGRHGYPTTNSDMRYPLSADLPVALAAREGAIVIRDSREVEEEFADLREAWQHAPALAGRQSVVSGPIIARGVVRGAYFLACDTPPTWDSLGYALLDGVGRALALWIERDVATSDVPETADALLTPRQVAILRQLSAGRTTHAMAAALGVSVSTVKTEVQRIGRNLNAHGRDEIVARARERGLLDVKSAVAP